MNQKNSKFLTLGDGKKNDGLASAQRIFKSDRKRRCFLAPNDPLLTKLTPAPSIFIDSRAAANPLKVDK